MRLIDADKVIKELEDLERSMLLNQCYACSHEFVETANEFGSNIILNAIALIKKQKAIIDQYHKADAFLDIHGWKWDPVDSKEEE